jgi:hypothetical protein
MCPYWVLHYSSIAVPTTKLCLPVEVMSGGLKVMKPSVSPCAMICMGSQWYQALIALPPFPGPERGFIVLLQGGILLPPRGCCLASMLCKCPRGWSPYCSGLSCSVVPSGPPTLFRLRNCVRCKLLCGVPDIQMSHHQI